MKAVIPAAGQGTRLYPQTHTKPKPMVRVAGKPILGHILDGLVDSPIDEVVIVIGVMRDHVISYVDSEYADRINVAYAAQESTEGLGHCIYQTRDQFDGDPMCIILGDMLFESEYGDFLTAHHELDGVDASIGVKRVDNPSSYGIVTTDEDGQIVDMVEKPDDPVSDLAISGIYFVEDTDRLFAAVRHLIDNDLRGAGDEYQLTDAFARMLNDGATLGTFDVVDWYDCGRPKTLLEANRVLLEARGSGGDASAETSVVVPPVDFGENVVVEQSVVGPYVSVDDGGRIENSRIEDAIVGEDSELFDINLAETLIGASTTVTGTPTRLNVGDSSELDL